MGVKPEWKPSNLNPGPGNYEPNIDVTMKSCNVMTKYEGNGSQERLKF